MNEIVNECGKFFEYDRPLIPDLDWLPYPKEVLIEALRWKERQLSDPEKVWLDENQKTPDIEKGVEALDMLIRILESYGPVEDDDRIRVNYFNGKYKNLADVIFDERMECLRLYRKYTSK